MLEAFIITLREGVEAALIVGITLAYLAKIGRPELRKSVYAALGAAFVGSIGVAVLLARTNFNQDIFEGWVMLAAAFFVVTMVIFMMRTGRKLKGEIEGKVGLLAGEGSWFGLFAFVFLMVLREGVETVLILGAVSLNTNELLNFIGTLLGVAAAVLFGVMFVKGSVRINLQKFFRVTTVILFFVAAQLIISGLHELSENGVLPSSKREMAIIGPIVRNDLFFFITILALAALMVLFEVKRRESVPVPTSPAERRKAAWSARRERLWMASVYASAFLFITLVTAEFIYAKSVNTLSPATEVTFVDGKASIPLKLVYDGDLHRFSAKENGTEIRFWLYQKPDGKIATVYDACEICGPVGFFKSSTGVVCKNCAAPINPQSVGMAGGCNPIPLKATVTSDAVIITEADVAAGARYFQQP
ncbi:MAG TPA: Fe-S-containing protein [Terriglobales bacterium]|nr:Fe-S-containing protein [Terriglobales bacterium]